MRPISGLVVHCSATPAGRPFRAADIDRWHRENGWNGIGYHFVIPLDGSIEPGRDLDVAGAHVSGHNARTIGICYVGGMNAQNTAPLDTLSARQSDALEILLLGLRAKWPNTTIRGHRDYPKVAKACPSLDMRTWCSTRGIDPK